MGVEGEVGGVIKRGTGEDGGGEGRGFGGLICCHICRFLMKMNFSNSC